MTEFEGYVCAPGDVGKIAIVVSRFNKTITDRLLEGALSKLREKMVSEDQITVVRVPGAFEIPTIAQRFACDSDYAAIICLGCVVKGETSHDEYINRAVSAELARIGSEYCFPVIFGILTCDTIEQAMARSGEVEVEKDKTLGERPGNKGVEAAEAALEMIDLMGKLPPLEDEDDAEDFPSLQKNAESYYRGDFESIDVDPDSLEDVDEEDEEENAEPWFLRGGGAVRKEKRQNERDDNRPKNSRRDQDRKGGSFGKGKSGKHGSFDKRSAKNGDKKRRK